MLYLYTNCIPLVRFSKQNTNCIKAVVFELHDEFKYNGILNGF